MPRLTYLSVFSMPVLFSLFNPLSHSAILPVEEYSLLYKSPAINAAGSPQSAPVHSVSTSTRAPLPEAKTAINATAKSVPVLTVTAEVLALQSGQYLPGHESAAEETDPHSLAEVNGVTYSSSRAQDVDTTESPSGTRHHPPNAQDSSPNGTTNAFVLPANMPSVITEEHIQLRLAELVIAMPFPNSLSGYLQNGSTFIAVNDSSFQPLPGNGTAIKTDSEREQKPSSNFFRIPIPQSAIDTARSTTSAATAPATAATGAVALTTIQSSTGRQ